MKVERGVGLLEVVCLRNLRWAPVVAACLMVAMPPAAQAQMRGYDWSRAPGFFGQPEPLFEPPAEAPPVKRRPPLRSTKFDKDAGKFGTPAGPLAIVVSIAKQRVTLFADGKPIAEAPVSTGTAGHETPMGIFAVIALVLAAVGIYGVMSYQVSQRTHEIGIRLALGANTRDVLKMVIKQGMVLALIGLGIGLGGAFLLSQAMRSILQEMGGTDWPTFGLVSLLMLLIALIACFIPAFRATKVDPMVALRYE